MSSLERREVTTTRVMRTLSPQRATSAQNISDFDNNLDHLLEDLQSSVSRPGSSLGNAYTETRTRTYSSGGKTDSLGRIQYMHPANTTTVVNDDMYNYKPADGSRSVKTYKTETYSSNYNREMPENVRMQNNINKLDTLMDDLQQVRQGTLDKDSSGHQVKRTVHRELVYDDKVVDRRQEREGSVTREVELIRDDGTYGDIRPIRHASPSRSSTLNKEVRTYNYSSDNTVPTGTEIVTVEPAINPQILAQLDPTLLPSANTKVTTTIKTYTYEIPGTGYPSAVSPKLSETVYSSNPSTPSRSFAYNKTDVSTHNVKEYPEDYVRPASPQGIGFKKHYVETTTRTSKNVTDGYGPKPSPTPSRNKEVHVYNERNINEYPGGSPPGKVVYKETTTTKRNVNQPGYPNGYPNNNYPTPPVTNKTYIINETHTTRNVTHPNYPNGYPPNPDPSNTTVIYKHDTHTSNYPPKTMTETFDPKNGPPSHYPRDPNQPMNITYKYTTHHTTSNNYKGHPGHPDDENEPLLHPPPFPTDGTDVGPDGKGPPKRLDELMAEFGNEPPNNAYNAGYIQRQAELEKQKKESASVVSTETQKKDMKDMPKSKNIAGPPVYYPPNHELFAHKEESGGYRAEGGMMKESGKYKYEAKSSSKSKSSSGVAVVPVCLPLCCGLPCAIL